MDKKTREEVEALLKKSQAHAEQCAVGSGRNPDLLITQEIIEMQNERGFLTISASSGMIPKSVDLFRRFINRMYKEGFTVTTENNSFYRRPASAVIVEGEAIPVRAKEPIRLKEIPWGSETKKRWTSTGTLCLEIYGGMSDTPNKVLKGQTVKEVEAQFEDIIPYLRKAAARIRKEKAKRAIWEKLREENRLLEQEHEKRITDRMDAVEELVHDAFLLKKVQEIRGYCDLMESRISDQEYLEKIRIVREVADWIDPTVDYTDALLAEKMDVSDVIRLME